MPNNTTSGAKAHACVKTRARIETTLNPHGGEPDGEPRVRVADLQKHVEAMADHRPAPWSVVRRGNGWDVVAANGRQVRGCDTCNETGAAYAEGEAHVVAAAPELVARLTAVDKLHQPAPETIPGETPKCATCQTHYPCDTKKAAGAPS